MLELVCRIYDCALQPNLWPEVLQDIANQSGAFGAMIFDCARIGPHEGVGLRYCSSVYDPSLVSWYIDTHNQHEVRDQARFANLSSTGDEVNLIRCDDLYSSRAELETMPNVRAMMEFGVHYRAGALLAKDSAAMDRFALQFRKDQGPMAEPARQVAQSLLPHVAKSLSIGRAFQDRDGQRQLLMQALDAMPFGVGIVKSGGAVVHGNREFHAMVAALGLGSQSQPGSLQISALPPGLQRLFGGLGAHGKFGARPLREAAFLPGMALGVGTFIEASPINDHPEMERFGSGTYFLSLLDTQRAHRIDPDTVRRFFPITKSEMSVLDLVARGHTNTEIADIRGRSLETVNSQLKSLIRKSGTRNRTELVRVAVGLSVAALNDEALKTRAPQKVVQAS